MEMRILSKIVLLLFIVDFAFGQIDVKIGPDCFENI